MSRPEVYQHLDTTGDGTGTTNMNVDGSGTPVKFMLQPAAGQVIGIERMLLIYTDGAVFASGKYAAFASALANGITFGIYNKADDTLLVDLMGGLPVQANADWGRMCYDATPDNFGVGNTYLTIRWTFRKDIDQALMISEDEYLAMTMNDDMRGLVAQYAAIRGKILKGA